MKLLKIPLDAGALSKKEGLDGGPDAVVKALEELNLSEAGMLPLLEVSTVALDNSNLGEAHDSIFREVLKLKDYAILIGGDHSMTYPAFKAFAKNNPGAGIIVFDAHPDLQDNELPPTHEDYLRVLIEQGIVEKERVIIVGARNMSKEELRFINDHKLKNYAMRELGFEGVREATDGIMSVARHWSKVYISVDIDVLDPAFAPGTGYCEPGGLTSRELIYMLQRLKMLRNIGMADLVEVNPAKDRDGLTVAIAAKLLLEL
jgi:arginase family enzyme